MVEFRALGVVALTTADGRALDALLAQPKRLALLAYLAVSHPPQFRRRDTILAYLWPELDDAHAHAALRQALHFVRQAVGAGVLVSRGEGELGLDRTQLWFDATAFDDAYDEGRASAALDLYGGDLLDGLFVAGAAPEFQYWLDAERARLRRRAGELAWRLVEQMAAAGQLAAAAQMARRATALTPDDEAALRRLITVLDECGDRAGAVRAYEDFSRRIAADLEVEPSVETKALVEAVRSRVQRGTPLVTASAPIGALDRPALDDLFTIEREIGRTYTAVVYRARDRKHDRPVLLKTLHRELAAVLGTERFLRETRLLARLQHPRIHALYDSGVAGGALYYTMPLLEGESLRERIDRAGRLTLPEAVAVAGDIADALAYAHAHGVVLRDLKPESILLVDGHAVVSDFGIARTIGHAGGAQLTDAGIVLGTPAYMSPEQARGATDLDARSDIYALGCICYEMIAGGPPYTGTTAVAVIAKQRRAPVPRIRATVASAGAAVEKVLCRALAKSPGDRYDSATAFAAALRRAVPVGI